MRFVDAVVHVVALNGAVGGDFHHIELVDVPELAGLGDGRTRHTRKFVVHAEIVLQRDGGKSLRGGLNFDVLFGLNSLVQAVAPAAAFHDTARGFVDDLHLSILNDVVVIEREHGISFEQLLERVHTVGLHGILGEELILLGNAFFVGEVFGLKCRELSGDVGEHEKLVVLYLFCQPGCTLVGEVTRTLLLVYNEIEGFHRFGHTAVVVLHVDLFGLEHAGLDAGFGEILDERAVFGERLVRTIERKEALFAVFFLVAGDETLGFREILGGQFALHLVKTIYEGLEFLIHLVVALLYRAGNDKRGTGVVDQHGVDLVDDGIIMFALHEIGRAHGHVVAQIVETELIVRTESDVGVVSTATRFAVRLVFVDAVYAQTVELVERSHPFGVTLSEVVVDGHHVHAAAGERAQEDGAGGHERLTFTGGHLCNFTLREHYATEKLHVIVHHFPFQVVAAGHPVVVIDGVYAVFVEFDEILRDGEFTVVVCGGDRDGFVVGKAASRFFHDGESLGKRLFECRIHAFEHLLLQLIDLREELFAIFDGSIFDLRTNFADLLIEFVGRTLDVVLQLLGLGAQLVVAQGFDGGRNSFDLVDPRLNLLHVASCLAAEKFGEEFIEIHRMFFTEVRGRFVLLCRNWAAQRDECESPVAGKRSIVVSKER